MKLYNINGVMIYGENEQDAIKNYISRWVSKKYQLTPPVKLYEGFYNSKTQMLGNNNYNFRIEQVAGEQSPA